MFVPVWTVVDTMCKGCCNSDRKYSTSSASILRFKYFHSWIVKGCTSSSFECEFRLVDCVSNSLSLLHRVDMTQVGEILKSREISEIRFFRKFRHGVLFSNDAQVFGRTKHFCLVARRWLAQNQRRRSSHSPPASTTLLLVVSLFVPLQLLALEEILKKVN